MNRHTHAAENITFPQLRWLAVNLKLGCWKNVFTLLDTDTDKMGLQPNCICIGVCAGQCEHFHAILYNQFFNGVCVGVGQCEHSNTVLSILVSGRQ